MTEADLEMFYMFIAFGEFDEALEFINALESSCSDSETVAIQALKIKKQLEKYLCPEAV